ncbi:hypothetical protein SFMTTN_3499 [Sulfuriferula multivorans]|uniref:Uncharacterized protein n=1 Tax=Sulfuriferula multivorans TaxID=1559896 RepID=A0A401JHW7_9PROT|nr:hypothetical protein SFMTTN_3499 [Sulfuriferula multivorans]
MHTPERGNKLSGMRATGRYGMRGERHSGLRNAAAARRLATPPPSLMKLANVKTIDFYL